MFANQLPKPSQIFAQELPRGPGMFAYNFVIF